MLGKSEFLVKGGYLFMTYFSRCFLDYSASVFLPCRFQSCHGVAKHALQALTMRSEYELLTNSIQASVPSLHAGGLVLK